MTLRKTKTRPQSRQVSAPRRLEATLKLNGGTYHQIERHGNVAIFEGPRPGMFEVVVIKARRAEMFRGVDIPNREAYPSSESWGTYGWSYTRNSHRDALKAPDEGGGSARTCELNI